MGVNEKWRANHKTGMAAAAAKTASRRLTGEALAQRRRHMREAHPCEVKGCKRTAYKGAICKTHWELVPTREKIELATAVMQAQLTTAAKYHARFLRDLNAKERSRPQGLTG